MIQEVLAAIRDWANPKFERIITATESLTSLGSDINEAKSNIDVALKKKGVETTTPTSTFDELVNGIYAIKQAPTTIAPSEYDAQMFADGTLYNLYQVLHDLKANGLVNGSSSSSFACIYLAEYYPGYDSIDLVNAEAYITSDNPNELLNSGIHYWEDNDGKMNRWVAYLFHDEGASYQIPDTARCPRSLFIGGHCGTVICQQAGRITEIVVPDEVDESGVQLNTLDGLNFASTQTWNKNIYLKHIKTLNGSFFKNSGSAVTIILDAEHITAPLFANASYGVSNLVLNKIKEISGLTSVSSRLFDISGANTISYLSTIEFPKGFVLKNGCIFIGNTTSVKYVSNVLTIKGLESGTIQYSIYSYSGCSTKKLVMPDYKYGTVSISSSSYLSRHELFSEQLIMPSYEGGTINVGITSNVYNIELGPCNKNTYINAWNPTNILADQDKLTILIDNIRKNILAKVIDNSGSETPLIFSVSAQMFNVVTEADPDLVADFGAKGWSFRGA